MFMRNKIVPSLFILCYINTYWYTFLQITIEYATNFTIFVALRTSLLLEMFN